MSILLVALLYSLWSTSFPIGKMIVAFSSPVYVTGIRMVIGGSALLLFLIATNRKHLLVSRKVIPALLVLAVFSVYLTNVLEFYGLQYLSASKTCFLYSLSPFFAALLSYIHFDEKMTFQKLIGMIIGLVGFLPSVFIGSGDIAASFSISTLPEIAVCFAAIFSVYGWVILRIIVKNENFSPIAANGYSMLLGGALALFHAHAVGSAFIQQEGITTVFTGVIAMTFISNIICFNLYGYMLKKYTATFLSFFGLLSPFFTSITSFFLLGEIPSPILLASTCILCFGLFIVYRAEITQGYIEKKSKTPQNSV